MRNVFINALRGIARNKGIFALFFVAAWIFGLSVQLTWIHTFCGAYSIWGADVFPCQHNLYRLVFGGPLGVAVLVIVYLLLFWLFAVAEDAINHSTLSRNLLLAVACLGFSGVTPLLDYKYNNIVYLVMFSGLALVLWLTMRQSVWRVLYLIRDFFFPQNGVNYDLRFESGLLEIKFKGKFEAAEAPVLYERLSLDFTLLPAGIKKVRWIITETEGYNADFNFIYLLLLGYCSMRRAELEVVADSRQNKILPKNPESGMRTPQKRRKNPVRR